MKLSYLSNLALVILVLLLFWLNNQPEIDKQKAPTISESTAESINSIKINRVGRQTVELKKTDSTWQLIKPIQAAANQTRVTLLLNLLNHAANQKLIIDDNVDLAKYGLASPQFSLFLNELQFDFGEASPIQKGRYVKHANAIYVVDDSIARLINSSANAFIDNQLINKSDRLVKLELPHASFELIDGVWQTNSHLNQDKILKMLEAWQHAQALQVISQPDITKTADIQLWFKDKQQPLRLAWQLEKQNLSLYDIDKQLNYQFTANLADALFLKDTSQN